MGGIVFLAVLALIGYFVYGGFVLRALNSEDTLKVEARASLIGYYQLHYRHYPEQIDNPDDKFIAIDMYNKTSNILRIATVTAEILGRDGDRVLFSFSGACASEQEDSFRILAGQRVEQACIVKMPAETSDVLKCQRDFPTDCFVTYSDASSKEHVNFRWWFRELKGHNKPIRLMQQIYDWTRDTWFALIAYFQPVNV
jgi:hypothetical protein